MTPPTCRTCGTAEWRHVCRGVTRAALKRKIEAVKAEKTKKQKGKQPCKP